jgi:hypothetical protein
VMQGIRLRNDLSTGAGDQGTRYDFGEYPLYASVAGRVYHELSRPANTQDDEPEEDPGLVTTVSLQCQSGNFVTTQTNSNSDGQYRFSRVPVGADCTLTESQPIGFRNAYNNRGRGAYQDSGQTGFGNSSISLIVPPLGSFDNNFAEFRMTPTAQDLPLGVPLSPAWLGLLSLAMLRCARPHLQDLNERQA